MPWPRPRPDRPRQPQPGEIRLHQVIADHRRRVGQVEEARPTEPQAVHSRAESFVASRQAEPQLDEALHHQRRVPLEQRHPREAAVVEVRHVVAELRVEVAVLVLERVTQLVGEHDLVHGRERAVLAHSIEPTPVGPLVVEARDVVLQQPRPQRAQVGSRGQQVEGQQQPLVRASLRHRVLGVDQLLQVGDELRAAQERHRHVTPERDAARLGHLGLEAPPR